ncbi:restriction endonuclease subunit S [Vibrio cholerae]|nr:restriction endonuclease subunit S [Vibrio cholerae]EKF9647003.1 restriction endonuclease subunit S [Vibrio cholerae]EKF9650832.1 restriction endonuclease subunit S [Vibrio cholerae]
MGSEIEMMTLGDVCYITDGAHAKVERQSSGVMYLTSKNIGDGQLKLDSFDFISDDCFTKLFTNTKRAQRRLQAGDVLMGIIGTFGNCYVYKNTDQFGISSSVAILRPDQNVLLPDYLYYYISSASFKAIVEKYKGGSVQGYTNIATLKALPIPVPSIGTQKTIVENLIPLDNKITLNCQINQTLEQMAQTLFKSWFVDFDPVMDNALDAGNPIPDELQHRAEARKAVRESEGFKPLPDEVRQLFPDAFEESELGWVPKGWEIKSSGDVIDVRDGTHASPKKSEHGFPLVTSKNLTSGRLDLSNAYLISSEDYEEVNKRSKVVNGDILLTMIGTLGVPCLISVSEVNFAIKNVGLFRTSQTPLFKNYFFELLKSREMQRYLDSRAAGTTQKYLSLKVLRNIPFLCPSDAVLRVFNQYAQTYESKVQQNTEQSDQLTKLRDTLLPKLISGELHLDEVELAVEQEAVSAEQQNER